MTKRISLKSGGVEYTAIEGSTLILEAEFYDPVDAFDESAVTSVAITITDAKTGDVVNARDSQDVKNNNGGYLGADGLFLFRMTPADTRNVSSEKGQVETRVILFEWAWVDDEGVTNTGRQEWEVDIWTVTENGPIKKPIVIGDDYLAANDRAFTWTVIAPNGVDAVDATCLFGLKHEKRGSVLVEGTVTDNEDNSWLLSFDLTKDDTAGLLEGEYEWSVEVRDASGNEITRVYNDRDCKVTLIDKQT